MATLVMKDIENNNLFKNQVLSHTPVSQLSQNSSHNNQASQKHVSQLSRQIHNRSKSSNPTQKSNFIKIEDMNDDDEQDQTSQFGLKADEPESKVDFYHQEEVDNRVAID